VYINLRPPEPSAGSEQWYNDVSETATELADLDS